MKLNFTLFISFLFIASFSFGAQNPIVKDTTQKTQKRYHYKPIKDQTLQEQYNYLLYKSPYNPEGKRLVENFRLSQIWKNLNDTLNKEKALSTKLNAQTSEQLKTINYLKTKNSAFEKTLSTDNISADNINFIGLNFKKNNYHLFVWITILILIIALIIIVLKSAKNTANAKEKTQQYQNLYDEFQNFKSKTVEKERKLARELQDERNKLDDLLKNN